MCTLVCSLGGMLKTSDFESMFTLSFILSNNSHGLQNDIHWTQHSSTIVIHTTFIKQST